MGQKDGDGLGALALVGVSDCEAQVRIAQNLARIQARLEDDEQTGNPNICDTPDKVIRHGFDLGHLAKAA